MDLSDLPYLGESMLDVTLRTALTDVVEHVDGLKYHTDNLHRYATRAVFNRTLKYLNNRELLLILQPRETSEHGAIDKRLAKHLRSFGKERSAKLQALRIYSIDLLGSRKLSNSDVVCGWVLALVYAATLDVVHAASSEELHTLRSDPAGQSVDVQGLIDKAHEHLQELALNQIRQARAEFIRGRQSAKLDLFLHNSAFGLLAVQAARRHPLATLGVLVEAVYPAIDDFSDPLE